MVISCSDVVMTLTETICFKCPQYKECDGDLDQLNDCASMIKMEKYPEVLK